MSATGSRWRRARRSYAGLIGEDDPMGAEVAEGAIDLRPGWGVEGDDERPMLANSAVVSGPDDLIELRQMVERMTGIATWPITVVPEGFRVLERRKCVIDLARPAAALAVVMAMEGLVVDRSGAWRTWKTVVDSIGSGLAAGFRLTFEGLVISAE